ncbi:hypothetical protein M9H77_05605 [Catharanthus roseus]|uniref:Uncharacterized protein n=1 Tax=Catharanthus roseus TaxID=4058 RepID=A0ACC0CHR5_CATRO|nr:hypothetical protein M9H77_05605 [Catharanthus roseus]
MECHMVSTAGQSFLVRFKTQNIDGDCGNSLGWNSASPFQKLMKMNQLSMVKNPMKQICWRTCCTSASLEEEFSALRSQEFSDHDLSDQEDDTLQKSPSSKELKSLLADSERSKLVKKLSEANQHNRFLKRELQVKEDALINFKSELSIIELEIEALVTLAKEVAKSRMPEGSRKINGKYIQSHLLQRLEAVQEKMKEQIKGVDVAQSKAIELFWSGVAESVQVMGSFDGWIEGEHLSPEYTGSYTKFSTTLMLRPGRYEIKFLVDGEWKLSPEFPTIGEGLTENNLLIVE